jgi:tRNA (guanine-N(7)-)-methyltransferase subunit TRM82
MPKRPCAIAVTADDSTIICADKFGDVYSLPLLYSISSKSEEPHDGPSKANLVPEAQSKPFIPAANNLTVHSVRNLRALQSQMKQTQKVLEKLVPDFERILLLGHVSRLTDIAVVEREGRSYIVTADRDEHIRISRGIPQAHVIERYCLGHKDFVSRLCFPGSRQNVLISGGGDDDLYVWDWYLGELVHSINLRRHVENFMSKIAHVAGENGEFESIDDTQSEQGKIAVSNIIYLGKISNLADDTIVVACEG